MIGIVTGGLLMLISPAIVHFAPLSDTAAEYLQYMLLFCGLNLMAQSVNTTVLDGIFCAGGDAKFDNCRANDRRYVVLFCTAWLSCRILAEASGYGGLLHCKSR